LNIALKVPGDLAIIVDWSGITWANEYNHVKRKKCKSRYFFMGPVFAIKNKLMFYTPNVRNQIFPDGFFTIEPFEFLFVRISANFIRSFTEG
jgi:hypothetical protein